MKSQIKIQDKDKSGIYKITNLINNDFYIGSAVKLSRRIYRHRHELKSGTHSNLILQRAVNKYGLNNFQVECLQFCNKEKLIELEQFHVDTLNPKYNIYKQCVNSNLGRITSEETKQKISKSNKGKTVSEETRLLLRNINLGKKHSEETKLKMSLVRKGKTISEETREKMKASQKGKIISVSSIEKSIKTKIERGSVKGSKNPKAKLNENDVINIKTKLEKISISLIAKEYNVSYQTIWGIKHLKNWL